METATEARVAASHVAASAGNKERAKQNEDIAEQGVSDHVPGIVAHFHGQVKRVTEDREGGGGPEFHQARQRVRQRRCSAPLGFIVVDAGHQGRLPVG